MIEHECESCGRRFPAKSTRARFCSSTCRSRAHRRRPDPPPGPPTTFEISTWVELERLKRLDSMLGHQAMLVARAMAGQHGSALVALSKEHSRLMASIGSHLVVGSDPLDEIGRRRALKARRARGES
jgi:hypothetical protein